MYFLSSLHCRSRFYRRRQGVRRPSHTPWRALAMAISWFAGGQPLLSPIRQQRSALIGFATTGLTIVILQVVPWPTRTRFFAKLYAIRPGMTRDEVEGI